MTQLARLRAAIRRQAADPLSRGWATMFSGTLARLALGFIPSVLLARALGPAGLGLYATLGAVATIGGALADLGLSAAAVRRVAEAWPAEPDMARRRASVFLAARAAVAGATALLAIALAPALSGWLPGRPPPALVMLALLGVAATSLSGATSALLQATGAFGRLSLVLMVNSGLTAALALALALAGQLTIEAALTVLGIGTTLVSLALGWWWLPLRHSAAFPSLPPLADARAEARALFGFAGWLWVANGFAMLASYLDLLLVGRFLPPTLLGQYALASNLAGKADVVNQSMHTVLLPAASQLQGRAATRGYLRRGLARSAALSLLLLVPAALAEPLISLFYGPAFLPAAGVFRLLLGVAIFDVWAAPLLLLAYSANRPWLLAAADAARVALLVAAGAWLIPVLGLGGAALARLVARAAGAALVAAGLRGRLRAPPVDTPPPAVPPSP